MILPGNILLLTVLNVINRNDENIRRHCAFSLPAVALTLGRANWPLLKVAFIQDIILRFFIFGSPTGNLRVLGQRHAVEGEKNAGQLDPRARGNPGARSCLSGPCAHFQRFHQGPG